MTWDQAISWHATMHNSAVTIWRCPLRECRAARDRRHRAAYDALARGA